MRDFLQLAQDPLQAHDRRGLVVAEMAQAAFQQLVRGTAWASSICLICKPLRCGLGMKCQSSRAGSSKGEGGRGALFGGERCQETLGTGDHARTGISQLEGQPAAADNEQD